MRYIELFAGIGGFRYGLEAVHNKETQSQRDTLSRADSTNTNGESSTQGGSKPTFSCVYTNEFNKYAASIYERNFNDKRNKSGREQPQEEWEHSGGNELHPKSEYSKTHIVDTRDIREVRAEEIPDHDLLTAGFPCQSFSIAGKRGGFEDTRGTLFFEIARIAKQKQPRFLLLENVKGLLSHDKGKTFGTILNTLDELGYDLQWQVLNSKNFGVPQNRERVFIVGHLRGTSRPEVFPIGTADTKDIIVSGVLDTETWRKRHEQIRRVHSPEGISPTIPTGTGGGVMTKIFAPKVRRLTPTECERLQGFPDGWTEGVSDTQRYKCLGNAVTTNVITAIGERLWQDEKKQ